MVEYPRKGVWTVGFVTGKVSAPLQEHLPEEMISVFIPTTPNPTSGWYAIMPKREAIDVDISIEEAFKVLISGGIVSPDSDSKQRLSLPKEHSKPVVSNGFASKTPGLITVEEDS